MQVVHDSVEVSTPDLQSRGTGYDPRQRSTVYMPRAHQAYHPSEVGKLVPASAGVVKSPLYGNGVVSALFC